MSEASRSNPCEGLSDIFRGRLRNTHMPLLTWKPEYSVNEAAIDNHHIKLFDILNTVYENVMNSSEVDCVLPIIDELSQYTKYHFSLVERNMREKGYHAINDHIGKHRELTHKIDTLKAHYHGNNLEVTQELIIVLGDWLLHHVLRQDRKYSELSTSNEECAIKKYSEPASKSDSGDTLSNQKPNSTAFKVWN